LQLRSLYIDDCRLQKCLLSIAILFISSKVYSQNKAIKCYFNHPVNTEIATGKNAIYLNTSFPDTIASYINKAKYSVDIAMYNYTSTVNSNVYKIAVAANSAANRGVQVRWLYNGTTATNNSGLTLLNNQVKTFASANYANYIMHNKFMVIDVLSPDSNDVVVQTGSYNFSDFQTSDDYNNIVFIQSKQVALAFYNEFNKMWGSNNSTPNAALAKFSTFKSASNQTKFLVEGTLVEVYFSPKDSAGIQLQKQIALADEDIFFSIFTFTDNTIANAIKTKYNNGIAVKGIMDEFSVPYNAYAILNPLLGTDMKVFISTDTYHNKVMLIDALNINKNPTVFTGSFNWSNQAQISNDENAVIIHDAAIANQYYQSLCYDYTILGGNPCVAKPCGNGIISILSSRRGNTYQWQQISGTGFLNLNNNALFTGTDTKNLQIQQPSTSWYGNTFRCLIDGVTFSDTTTLQFTAYWNGQISNAWENPLNWNCNVIPDANTDVVINATVPNMPVVNNSNRCRSIRLNKNTQLNILVGVQFLLTGN
jgi:hypothetical protein